MQWSGEVFQVSLQKNLFLKFVLRVTYFILFFIFFILFFLDTCKIVVLLITMKTLAEKKKELS